MRRNPILRMVALLLVIPVFLIGCALLPAQYSDSFSAELSAKLELLEDAQDRPRIILIGGSAAAFGVDTAMLEEALPQYAVVHFGLYAGFGMPMMLELAQQSLRSGDLVLVMPEQQRQSLSDYFNAEPVWQAADGDFQWLLRLDSRHWGAMTSAFPAFAMNKLRYAVTGKHPAADAVYCRASFDAHGDLRNPAVDANRMPGGWDVNMPVSLTAADLPDREWLTVLNEFVIKAGQKGAGVEYVFCPMNRSAVTEDSDADAYYEALCALLPCTILGDPNDSLMEAGWFYDTNFHLNQAGQTVFTYRLIRAIKAEQGISLPTVIDLPDIPVYSASVTEVGDNRDAGCFTWEEKNGRILLTGLTPEGRARSELTIPSEIEGKPVCTLTDGLFSGSAVLRSVTLQWTSPNDCTAGQGLLEGVVPEFRIYVPRNCSDAYKLNYFWSVYSERIHEQE